MMVASQYHPKLTYCFDLDGTLCTQSPDGDYSKAEPIIERIKKLNELYDRGDKIIIMTARGMSRFDGDVDLCYNTFYEYTEKQLKQWGIKYHQLILGKPSADWYIDDKGKNDYDYFDRHI